MAQKFLNGVKSYFNASNYTLLGYDSLDVVGGDLVLKRAGSEKLRIGANTATFAGDVTVNGSHLTLANGTTSAAATDYLYIGGAGLGSADAAIYIGNGGGNTQDGYGYRIYYSGVGTGNNNKLIFKSENYQSAEVDMLTFTADGKSTFSQDATFAGDISIPVAKKLYFGGGSHTYIGEDIDDRLRFFVGGAEFMRFTEDTADTIFVLQDVKPITDSSIDLGATNLRFANIYADTLYGDGSNLTGVTVSNADTVDNLHAASFIRSDADDTATGIINFTKKAHDYDTIPPNQNLLDIASIKIANKNDIYGNATKTVITDYVAKYVNDNTGGTTIRLYVDDNILVDGDTYMVSVYYENLIGQLFLDFADETVTGNGSQTGTSSAPKSGRIYGYASKSDYTSTYRFFDISLSQGSGHEVTLHSPKVEAGTTLTDFVATERTDIPTNSIHVRELIATGGLKVIGPGSHNFIQSANDYTLGFNDSNGVSQWWIKNYTNGGFAIHENGVGDKFTIAAGGNATFAGNVDVDGGTLNVGSSDEVSIVSSGSSHFPSLKVNNNGYVGSASVTDALKFLSSGDLQAKTKIGVGVDPTTLLHLKGTGDAIRVESTNTGAGGAQMDLIHYTTSPADDDIHGVINFGGYYSGTSSAYGSSIRSVWSDVSAKHGQLEFWTRDDSDFAQRLKIDHDGTATFTGNISALGGSFTDPVTIYDSTISENPRLSVGRNAGEAIQFDVTDRVATIRHKNDSDSNQPHDLDFIIDTPSSGNKIFNFGVAGNTTSTYLTIDNTGATFAGDVTSTGLTVDYTGNRTGDAGILVTNDNDDWGIKVDKDGTTDYGILSQTDGENAIVVRNAAGTNKIQLQGDGDATFEGDVTASSGTGHFSVVNASGYQLNGTYIVDSSKNLVNISKIRFGSSDAVIDTGEVTSATATTIVSSVTHGTYNAAFFDFVIKNGTNVRAGTVYACHNGASTPLVEFAETSTVDLGDTSDVTLDVVISGANMVLRATTTSSTWTIKTLIRVI